MYLPLKMMLLINNPGWEFLILKIGIINVGVNASHGNLRSPIFNDGTFEFVPIPIRNNFGCLNLLSNCLECPVHDCVFPRYDELISPNERNFSEFIPKRYLKWRTDNDPEFVSFTYGDFPSRIPRASNLQELEPGDQLFFLARLVNCENGCFIDKAGFYLIGFFEIEKVFNEIALSIMVKFKQFDETFKRVAKNGHMLLAKEYPDYWIEKWSYSWVFSGSKRFSKRFHYAVPFNRKLADEAMLDAKGRRWTWPDNQTELQRIGSYTRSCMIIREQTRIDKLWSTIDNINS